MSNRAVPYNLEAAQPFTRGKRVTIEASAGTGKTYALTATVARLVAEQDLQPNELLLMTFTNEATEELRQVTRTRCQDALAYLQGNGAAEPWMKHLSPDDSPERETQKSRLARFLTRYDEVTITTIHGFCQMVLKRAGLSSLAPPNFELLPSVDHIVDQVMTDLLAAKLAANPGLITATFDKNGNRSKPVTADHVKRALNAIRTAAKAVLNNDGAVVLPAPVGSRLGNDLDEFAARVKANEQAKARVVTDLAHTLADEVRAVVSEVRSRCSAIGVVTYNDLIRLVRESLDVRNESGVRLAGQLSEQYPVVMVDEFQDTDSSQAAIFDAIFETGNGATTLFTVGDPKQAIYRFRGADVNVYLNARNRAHEVFELNTNWRSDPPMLAALQSILGPMHFDIDEQVGFVTVNAPPSKPADRIGLNFDAPTAVDSAAVEFRYLPKLTEFGSSAGSANDKARVEAEFRADLALRVKQLLRTATVNDPKKGKRRLSPADCAVLVHNHKQAESFVQSLVDTGIPAVQLKTGSVFSTEAARHWLMFLKGLSRPASPSAVRTFALSWFGGCDENFLLTATESQIAELQRKCAEAAKELSRRGITATYLAFRNNEEFLTGVLSHVSGLRHLTDLDHIAEVLESHPELVGGAGPAETLAVLLALTEEQSTEIDDEQRRIQTDLDAVKVMTIYASKGLEFPVVFLPTLIHVPPSYKPYMFPARLEDGRPAIRVIDVASGVDGAAEWRFTPKQPHGSDVSELLKDDFTESKVKYGRKLFNDRDVAADRRRLFYVAMTRAKHKLITYWSPAHKKKPHDQFTEAIKTGFGIDLIAGTNEDLQQFILSLTEKSGNTIAGVDISQLQSEIAAAPDSAPRQPVATMNVAGFVRDEHPVAIDGYRRWSYSYISGRLKGRSDEARVAPSVEELPGVTDEADDESVDSPIDDVSDRWKALPKGKDFGNAVHQVLDRINPAADDLAAEVARGVDDVFASWTVTFDHDQLVAVLTENLTVPLDSIYGGYSLAQLGTAHRLSELRFDFPLRSSEASSVRRIIEALVDDPGLPELARDHFTEMMSSGSVDFPIGGFMTGSIDAVFRIPTESPSFIVCDYKTNKLHPTKANDRQTYYDQPHLVAAMLKEGYYYQAVVYSVALHRFLRYRLPDYSFSAHFGGVSYLFLRGLTGTRDESGALHGSYIWTPSEDLVRRVDDLFSEELK